MTLNLGSGLGYSVREVVQAAENVTGRPVPFTIGRRRNGDVGQLVCNGDLAKLMLGWHAINSTLEQMIFDAWNWHQKGGFVR